MAFKYNNNNNKYINLKYWALRSGVLVKLYFHLLFKN